MKTTLPKAFIEKMELLLDGEYPAFLKSYDMPKTYGLRRNLLQTTKPVLPFTLEPVHWASEGYYAKPEEHPGRHPLHEAGAYYIQEPSAMAVVSLLDPQPGETVCDLCAAPGGKSTQIAGRLQGQGLLISNEIISSRAKILSQNIERLGVRNALVCNESPDVIARFFPSFFQRVLVDAPCSGEGMFRKEEKAVLEWNPEQITICQERQKMILEQADQILQPGGILVYSTCTFAPEEDELMIAWFLSTHHDYVLEDWKTTAFGLHASQFPDYGGLCSGRPDWGNFPELNKTLRLWPHKLQGEGHFAARLRKTGNCTPPDFEKSNRTSSKKKKSPARRQENKELSSYQNFYQSFLQLPAGKNLDNLHRIAFFGDQLYLLPENCPSLDGLKILRAGLHLGTNKKNRFEPAHALAKALQPSEACFSLDVTETDAKKFLHGETLSCPASFKGWTLVCYQCCPLGWGKAQNGLLKNHFPKGLRWL